MVYPSKIEEVCNLLDIDNGNFEQCADFDGNTITGEYYYSEGNIAVVFDSITVIVEEYETTATLRMNRHVVAELFKE